VSVNDVMSRIGEIRSRLNMPPLQSGYAAPMGGSQTIPANTQLLSPTAVDFESALATVTGQTAGLPGAVGLSSSQSQMDPLAQPAGTGLLSTDAELGSRMSEYAVNFVGVPYVAGGNNPKTGWDCAAFTEWIAQQHGLSIPPVSWQQIKVGEPVASLKDARAGDLVFFHEPSGHSRDPSALKVNHVGLYLGDGRMVEAANPSADTRISEVSVEKLVGIRRLAGPFNG